MSFKVGEWDNNVLISLRRAYGKDETVSALNKKLSLLEIEIGKLKSERDEAIYNLKNAEKIITKNLKKELSRKINLKFKNALSKKDKTISMLRKSNSELIAKLNSL